LNDGRDSMTTKAEPELAPQTTAAARGMEMGFDTELTLMMLLALVSWIAALIVLVVVFRSFVHPRYGDGNLAADGINPVEREADAGKAAPSSAEIRASSSSLLPRLGGLHL